MLEQLIFAAEFPRCLINHLKRIPVLGMWFPIAVVILNESDLVTETSPAARNKRVRVQVEIEVAVPIVIAKRRHRRGRCCWILLLHKAAFEGAIALVAIEFVVVALVADKEIQVAVVVDIGKGRSRTPPFLVRNPYCLGGRLQRSMATFGETVC